MTSPEMAALRVVRAVEGDKGFGADLDLPSLIDRLRTQASAVNSGEMQQVEAMLMTMPGRQHSRVPTKLAPRV